MSQALNATGRPILYSMCNWGEDGPWNFAVVRLLHAVFPETTTECVFHRLLQTVGAYLEILSM